jgi:molybdenum cofactor biosynthesis enzyme MoaA
MFTLEVSVTEKCNLGCPYCYVANRPTWMTKEVFDQGMKDLPKLMQRSGGPNNSRCSLFKIG